MEKNISKFLFGSQFRIYLLRYLFFNPSPFELKKIESFFQIEKNRTKKKEAKKEIKELLSLGLLRKSGEKFYLKNDFYLLPELKILVSKFSPDFFEGAKKIFKPFRKIVFLGLGGIFLQGKFSAIDDGERLDVLIVLAKTDDKLEKKIEKKISALEKSVGSLLNFSILTKKDFLYKRSMFDKFLENWFNEEPVILIERVRI